jgi:hypothetical protein
VNDSELYLWVMMLALAGSIGWLVGYCEGSSNEGEE